MPFRACLLAVFLMLPALAAAQQLQLVFSPPASFDSGTFGNPDGEKGFGFLIQKTGAGTLEGPFTIRIVLPDKVTYAGINGAGATCSAAGQLVTCIMHATLTDWM